MKKNFKNIISWNALNGVTAVKKKIQCNKKLVLKGTLKQENL